MAYKVFSNGDALTGSELNTYLMNQSVMVFATATARDAALTTPSEGMVVWLQDSDKYVYYTGSAWANLLPVIPSGNALINSSFDIAQRGTSFTNPTSGSYLLDRWRLFYDGSGATRIISQQTHTPGSAPLSGQERSYFLRWNQTVAGSGATYNVFQQPIEDVRTFAGQTVTLSFYAKAATAGNIGTINLVQGFGTGGSSAVSTTLSFSQAINTSWARYTYTTTLPSISGKTIGTNNSLTLEIAMPYNAAFTFDFDGVQLEAGSVATPFKRNAPSIQAELAACQRYYLRSAVTTGGAVHGSYGAAYSTTNALIPLPSHNTMRVVPTSIEWTNVQLSDGVGGYPATGITVWGSSTPDSPYANVTVSSGLTQFRPYYISSQNSASASYVGFSAEL